MTKWITGLGLAFALVSTAALAQHVANPPNEAGVTMGHVHLNVRDIAASKQFWTALGGAPIKVGTLEAVKFPGVLIILRQAEPTGGSAGTIVDHVGFLVKDGAASVATFKALGTKMELKDRKSTRLNSSHVSESRMPSSA